MTLAPQALANCKEDTPTPEDRLVERGEQFPEHRDDLGRFDQCVLRKCCRAARHDALSNGGVRDAFANRDHFACSFAANGFPCAACAV